MEEHTVKLNRALPASVCILKVFFYMHVKHMNKDNNMNQPPVEYQKIWLHIQKQLQVKSWYYTVACF